MIRKCLNGEIDMILTKSISRFSRNTPDTIKYVRMLRDKNIAIMFEKENINTLDMNGEMLLTILSGKYICICKKRFENEDETWRTCWL